LPRVNMQLLIDNCLESVGDKTVMWPPLPDKKSTLGGFTGAWSTPAEFESKMQSLKLKTLALVDAWLSAIAKEPPLKTKNVI